MSLQDSLQPLGADRLRQWERGGVLRDNGDHCTTCQRDLRCLPRVIEGLMVQGRFCSAECWDEARERQGRQELG